MAVSPPVKEQSRSLWLWSAVMTCIAVVLLLAVHASVPVIIATSILFVLAPFFLAEEFWALLLFVAIRPSLDSVGSHTLVTMYGFDLNIAALTGLVAILWAFFVLVRHRLQIAKNLVVFPVVLFLLISLVGLFWTISTSATTVELVRLFSVVMLYLAASILVTTRERFRRLCVALASSLIVPIAVATYQIVTRTGFQFFDLQNRAYGTFGHPNVFAFYLVLTFTLLGMYVVTEKKLHSFGPFLGLSVLFLFLVLTYTRGAWLGLLVAGLLIGFFRFRKFTITAIVAGALVVLLFPLVTRWTFDNTGTDLSRLPVITRLTQTDTDYNSLDWRFGVWHDMAGKALEKPFTGFGLGSFAILRALQINDVFASTEAHNDYLRLAVETGFPGLAVYVVLLAAFGDALVRTYTMIAEKQERMLVLGMLGFLGAFCVMSYFDNLLQGTPVMWAFWILLAATLNIPLWQKGDSVRRSTWQKSAST